jgi:hypothetical protein
LFYAFSDLKLEGVNGDSKGDERKKRLKTYEVLLAYYATSVVISP